MANTSDWGKIYCFTEFGEEDFTIVESIREVSIPSCFSTSISEQGQIETMALTVDDLALYSADDNEITADKTII